MGNTLSKLSKIPIAVKLSILILVVVITGLLFIMPVIMIGLIVASMVATSLILILDYFLLG